MIGISKLHPGLSMPRTRMRSGDSRKKKIRHLPTRKRSSPGRPLRDFTSPWPVAAKRTRAASIRAWTTRIEPGQVAHCGRAENTRRITARAGAGVLPRGYRRRLPYGPDRAWPRFRRRRFPAHPIPQEKRWPPVPQCPAGHPRGTEGARDPWTCFNCSFTGNQPLRARISSVPWGARATPTFRYGAHVLAARGRSDFGSRTQAKPPAPPPGINSLRLWWGRHSARHSARRDFCHGLLGGAGRERCFRRNPDEPQFAQGNSGGRHKDPSRATGPWLIVDDNLDVLVERGEEPHQALHGET